MAAAKDVLEITNFVLSFPTGCLGCDLGLNCQFLRNFLHTFFLFHVLYTRYNNALTTTSSKLRETFTFH